METDFSFKSSSASVQVRRNTLDHGAFNVLKSSRALCPRFSRLFKHSDHIAWGRRSWSLCFLYICLFVLRVFVCFAAVCDCGIETFLLTFFLWADILDM